MYFCVQESSLFFGHVVAKSVATKVVQRSETKRSETKRNEAKRNETKRHRARQGKRLLVPKQQTAGRVLDGKA